MLVVRPMDSSRPTIIPECARVEFTRLRLGSHRLRVEAGRWSHNPRDQRYCKCAEVLQDKEHVLLHCPKTQIYEKNTHGY